MIKRKLQEVLIKDAKKAPVIAILGPRQSGKTTLARATFPNHVYISLEDLDTREFAQTDPRRFLSSSDNDHGIILDEVQNVPDLLSYIQTIVDSNYRPGYFILTGSQNLLISDDISQTLAGRVSKQILLPLSIKELADAQLLPQSANAVLYNGFYPIIYGRDYNATDWYRDYIQTYIERDVRKITNVSDLALFKKFIKLCAGRMGQIVNLTQLGDDCGISYNTVRSWLSILAESYIIFLLEPYFHNTTRRLTKSPKIYFNDPGVACFLLGIETPEQVGSHYLRGGLFECMIIADLFKNYYNTDREPHLYFWRDKHGNEVDCILERANQLYPIEIKAGETISSDYFHGLEYWHDYAKTAPEKGFLVYGGSEKQSRSRGTVIPWSQTFLIPESTEK